MVSDWFKELDRLHRLYVAIALLAAGVPGFFMAFIDGFRTSASRRTNEILAEIMTREVNRKGVHPEVKALQVDLEEYIDVHNALDNENVPRLKDGNVISLWGRLSLWRGEMQPTEESPIGHMCSEYECVMMALDHRKVPTHQEHDNQKLSLWGRIEHYTESAKVGAIHG